MVSRAAQRLLALESDGIVFSRNKNFEFFDAPENRGALRLFRRLRRLGELLTAEPHGPMAIHLERVDTSTLEGVDDCADHQLCMALCSLAGTYRAYLFADEYALLWRDEVIAGVLAAHGLRQPDP